MPIITLTSDLGVSSHYPAVVKGIILSAAPHTTLVDVSHLVPNFDTMEAAYLVRNSYRAFPAGTVHLIAVDPDEGQSRRGVAVFHDGHYFVGPNNGVLSLIFGPKTTDVVEIAHPDLERTDFPPSFRAARWLASCAAFLATGGLLEEVGPPAELKELVWGDPSYADNCLRGKIVHIDKFGNAITNIRRDHFLQLKQERGFQIFIRNVRLRRIVQSYPDVGKGDALAIFGSSQQLEIAIREGQASSLLGLKVHDMITIEFYGN